MIGGAAALGVGMLTPAIAGAYTDDFWIRDRGLWLYREETKDASWVTYWSGGQIVFDNYVRLCHILRDWQKDETVMMDVNLLNLLYGTQYWQQLLIGKPAPLIVTSGFRTDETNRKEKGKENSEHKNAKAADIKSLHFTPKQVAQMFGFFGMGGIGVYDTFTHGDSGRVRFWDGSKAKPKPTR
ncbi:MAG: YcbK family protein [Pseudomonadales bacterium]